MRTLMAFALLASMTAFAAGGEKCESDCDKTAKEFEKRCADIMKKKNATSGGFAMCKDQQKSIGNECKKRCTNGKK